MTAQDRLPFLYPSHFATYAQCPERYFHERIERRRVDEGYNAALAKGIAVHAILAEAADARRNGRATPSDAVRRAEATVPRPPYPSEQAWLADVETVARAVAFGLEFLDGGLEVLASEATYYFPYIQALGCPPFVLAAKVDLVGLRRAEDGRVLLDIVDWKTGAGARTDPFQEVAARIVVSFNATTRFGIAYEAIQSSTVCLTARAVHTHILDEAACRRVWSEMKGIADAILDRRRFPPAPSLHCEWCPFFANSCSLAAHPNQAKEVGAWLDDLAEEPAV